MTCYVSLVSEIAPVEMPELEEAHHKSAPFWILWVAVGLLLIYPLSIGPVTLIYQDKLYPNGVRIFYSPLAAIYHRSPAAQKVIDWYFNLWRGRP